MGQSPFRKRVLFLAPYLGDGGINRHMLTLGSELRDLGWAVAICSGGALDRGASSTESAVEPASDGGRAPLAEDYERSGIAYFEMPVPRSVYRLGGISQLLRLPITGAQVVRTVRRFRPAILHSHSRQMGVYARAAQSLTGVPFVSTAHNPIPTTGRLWSHTVGARAIAVSAEIGDIMVRDYRVDRESVRVIPAGADAERFRPPNGDERRAARERLDLAPHPFVLAFVGALVRNKHPETLVEAVARLVGESRDVVALLAGVGPAEEELRTQVARLGLDRHVRLLGYQDAREVLWAADALVLPSESEGSPVVVAEAMLSGVVALSTPAGAAQQITPDVTGVVFPVGDAAALAGRIASLIDDPARRESIASDGLVEARARFSSAGMAKAVEGTYLEVLGQGR